MKLRIYASTDIFVTHIMEVQKLMNNVMLNTYLKPLNLKAKKPRKELVIAIRTPTASWPVNLKVKTPIPIAKINPIADRFQMVVNSNHCKSGSRLKKLRWKTTHTNNVNNSKLHAINYTLTRPDVNDLG
jgi:hypothetical protein